MLSWTLFLLLKGTGTAAEVHSPELRVILQECISVQGPPGTMLKGSRLQTLLLHEHEHTECRPESTLDVLLPRKPSFEAVYLAKRWFDCPLFFKEKKKERSTEKKLFSESYRKSYENLALLSPTFTLADIPDTQ